MKIGILTFHRAINYGAVLQCYALQEYLISQGHEVHVIDYRPDCIEKYRRVFSNQTCKRQLLKFFFVRLIELIKMPFVLYTNYAFDSFLSSKLNVSKKLEAVSDLYGVYDVIIFGSDQIWSPSICDGFDKIYFGQFPHKGTKLISYAASIGGHNVLTSEQWLAVHEYLKVFDSISVREDSLYSKLNQLNINCRVVVDPTLLLSSASLEKLALKPRHKNYVLLFMLEENESAYDFALNIAAQTGSKVIRIQATKALRHRNDIENVEAVNPQLFCGYIKYANCIVNISFHGTVFSILYNRPFYTLHSFQEDRAANLLNSLNLNDRLVDARENVEFSEIDYSIANKTIDKLRQGSMNYINQNLG